MSPMSYQDDPRWGVFLEQVIRVPDRTTALATAQITLSEYYERIDADTDFASECSKAFDLGIDSLEDLAVKRAVFGVEKPVWWNGQVVGYETQYSERLLIFLLSGNRSKYRGEGEKSTQLSDEARKDLENVFKAAMASGDEKSPASPLDPGGSGPTKLPKKLTPRMEKDFVAKLAVTPASTVEVRVPTAAPSLLGSSDDEEVDGAVGIDMMKGASDAVKARRGSAKMAPTLRKNAQETVKEVPATKRGRSKK